MNKGLNNLVRLGRFCNDILPQHNYLHVPPLHNLLTQFWLPKYFALSMWRFSIYWLSFQDPLNRIRLRNALGYSLTRARILLVLAWLRIKIMLGIFRAALVFRFQTKVLPDWYEQTVKNPRAELKLCRSETSHGLVTAQLLPHDDWWFAHFISVIRYFYVHYNRAPPFLAAHDMRSIGTNQLGRCLRHQKLTLKNVACFSCF